MKKLKLRLIKQSIYKGILHPRERERERERERLFGRVWNALASRPRAFDYVYIYAIEFRIFATFEKLYMKKKVQTTIKFTTFSKKKKKKIIIIKFYAKNKIN